MRDIEMHVKYSIAGLVSGLCAAIVLVVLRWSPVGTSVSQTGEHVTVEPKVIEDSPQVRPSQRLTHTFRLRNNTARAIALKIIEKSCKCSSVSMDGVLKANGETQAVVEWDVPNVSGNHSYRVVFRTNTIPVQHIALTGKVSVRDIFHVLPDVVNMGELKPGETKASIAELIPPMDKLQKFAMSVSSSNPDECIASIEENDSEGARVRISVTGHSGKGLRRYNVNVTTNDPRQPTIAIPVRVKHLERYFASPAALLINRPKENATYRTEIGSTDSSQFTIDSIEVDDPSLIDVFQEDSTKGRHQLRVELRSKEIATATGKIQVQLLDANGIREDVTVAYVVIGNEITSVQ